MTAPPPVPPPPPAPQPAPLAAGAAVALVESPVQLLNVLEWAHVHPPAAAQHGAAARGPEYADASHAAARPAAPLTIAVLAPGDPISRGQLRRMAELARDEGAVIRWYEARGGRGGLPRTAASIAPMLLRARRLVIGDPFSRLVQLLLPLCRAATEVTVVDDGTATLEFTQILDRRGRLVRWHRSGRGMSPADVVFAPFATAARRRLTPRGRYGVELFSAMPAAPPAGMALRANRLAWTRSRFGPPRILDGADLIGTSLVETGVVDEDRYLAVVASLAGRHGARRYFAHRRESVAKLHRLAAETGLEIVRPDLPLELVARRGPIARTVLSFPSTVVHTLPLALADTPVRVTTTPVHPTWLTPAATPQARTFLTAITPDVPSLP